MKCWPTIAFFGSSLLSAYWNGAATYYRGILRALADRGFRTTFFEPDAYGRQAHRDIEPPSWARVVVYPGHDERGALAALERARDFDILVKASGVGVFDSLLERGILALKRPSNLVAFWDVDAPATLRRMREDPCDRFRHLVPQYDMVLTYGGGQPVVDAYRDFGARRVVPVYNALDPETHHPVPAEDRWRCDLALLANRLPDREKRVHEFFVGPAARAPERSFLLGGSGWEAKGLPPNVRCAGHVFTRDHNALNASALAVLNVARDSMAEVGFSPATRVFEAAGAGACLITDAWKGIELFLEPGKEVLVAHDGDEVLALLAGLDPTRAQSIGAAARARVFREHTYAHRASDLTDWFTGTRSAPVVVREASWGAERNAL